MRMSIFFTLGTNGLKNQLLANKIVIRTGFRILYRDRRPVELSYGGQQASPLKLRQPSPQRLVRRSSFANRRTSPSRQRGPRIEYSPTKLKAFQREGHEHQQQQQKQQQQLQLQLQQANGAPPGRKFNVRQSYARSLKQFDDENSYSSRTAKPLMMTD